LVAEQMGTHIDCRLIIVYYRRSAQSATLTADKKVRSQ